VFVVDFVVDDVEGMDIVEHGLPLV
jgi:hypothetical protein